MEESNSQCPFVQFTNTLLVKTELNQTIYHLQHDSGFNVNIVLYLLWLAKECYGRLTKRDVKLLQSQVMLWHQRVITELKYTHALVANSADATAVQIKQLLQEEIVKAHRIEQQMLYESHIKKQQQQRSLQQQLSDACMSIIRYCELKNDLLVEDDQAAFVQLLSLVFDHVARFEIEKQMMLAFNQLKSAKPAQLMWEEL